ncbi:MAG: FAD-dependent monooxygenase [Pyrinomonadaceae bacterium]
MKINVIGGGPAGLYFALLMKRRDASHQISIFERNSPHDTFGWGVVFSGKTLANLAECDEESYGRIKNSFETWNNVDVVHRAERISVGGNHFFGIRRIKLLNILQERCAELGVDLRFGVDVQNIEQLAEDCDLFIGADGVNSFVRSHYKDFFQPSLSVGRNKYIWYGTHQLFHGLTLTFRESEAGVFAAHSYKFDKETSTFIVECDEETWRRAGLDAMSDDDARRYLARVFAHDLNGHELLSNNSKWINFLLVKNLHWYHRNVVLLGDALHTAHFSIGSGTKLALEDAIALFRSFVEAESVRSALESFEAERKPVIEEYQAAALESMAWFENMHDYMHLDPLALAYELMTRSKRVNIESLRRRDPAFFAAYEMQSGNR